MAKRIAPLAQYLVSPIFRLWLKEIKGLENLPREGPFILAPNHCSYIEHPFIATVLIPYLNRKLFIIAKKEHFESTSQSMWHGLWNKYISYIPIDRSKGQDAMLAAEESLKNGAMLLIYPEGTRSLDGKLQKAKTGIARLVLAAHVPVVPIGFIGTFEVLPKGKKIPRFKRASMHIGKPIHFDRYYNKPITHELLREMTDLIMKEIADLTNKHYGH